MMFNLKNENREKRKMQFEEILKRIMNISVKPRVYYGLHMVPGVAEYRPPNEEAYRIYLGEEAVKNMDPTFKGCPVYVQHVDEVDMRNIQNEADGYVIRSFYNKADGKHWAEFIIVTDLAIEAIEQKKWKLSNCYLPKSFSSSGLNHGVTFQKEVTNAEYEHLAIVPNPRYEESIILTPEQFKAYNDKKEQELLRVANSKGDKEMKLFKKSKVENSTELLEMSVTLPESKTEKTVSECIEIADKFMNMHGYANGDHMVQVGEDEMSVNDLCKAYNKMKSAMDEEAEEKEKNSKKKNAEDEAEKKRKENMTEEEKAAEAKKNAEEEEKKKKENAEKEAAEKKANEDKEKAEKEKKENELKQFNALKNAEAEAIRNKSDQVYTSEDRVALGKSKYGSGR